MNRLFFVLIVLLATPLLAEDKKDGEKKTSEEKGKFSVEVPEKGFEWKKTQDINSPIAKGAVYSCEEKNSIKTTSLTIFYHTAKTDKERRTYIEGNFDGFRKSQEQNKGKILAGDKPNLPTKIPDQVSFSVKAQNANGFVFYAQATVIFGKNIFSILTMAEKADEAKALNEKIVKSFKELDK